MTSLRTSHASAVASAVTAQGVQRTALAPVSNVSFKKVAAEILWHSSRRSRAARRALKPYGMRIQHEWLGSRTGSVHLANGRTAKLSSVGQSFLAFELHWKGWQYFSPFSILTMQALLRDADAFFDLGANIGYYSLFAASERPDIAVTAFEPSPKNFALLSANAALNGSRITCENAAVSDATGTHVFHLPHSPMSGSLEAAFNPSVERTETVKTYRLDDYVAEHPIRGRPLLKVIIEGHEPQFIRGAAKLLDEHRPDMIMAVSKPWDDETLALLHGRGYSFHQITDQGLVREERLTPCKRERWFFLEHLVTTRSERDVRALSASLAERFGSIVLAETNTNRPDLLGHDAVW